MKIYHHLLFFVVVFAPEPLPCAPLVTSTVSDSYANDGACSLREAISVVNAGSAVFGAAGECGVGVAPPYTRINLIAGTYRITRNGTPGNDNVFGDFDINGASLELIGPDPATTVIRGNRDERVFDVGPSAAANVTISGVTVRDGGDVQGGAMRLAAGSSLLLQHCAVSNNDAQDGGAIWSAGALTVERCVFHANVASGNGGAIAALSATEAQIRDVTFNANESAFDGAAMWVNGSARLNNVTAAQNIADNDFNGSGDGAVFSSGVVHLSNTVLAGNVDLSLVVGGSASPDCTGSGGALVSDGYNLIGNLGANCAPAVSTGDQFGTAAAIIDAKLLPFAIYVGTLESQPPSAISPATETGNPAIPSGAPTCDAVDQQGLSRPVGARCDIGASESTDRIFRDGFE